ncbi:MAG: hypothetical protein J5808_04165 [Paludibacteraceae bacterium]|nr:hypothetical protein [Paludibacteraceae bacterium]
MRILKTAIATCSVLVAVLSMAEIASCLLNPDTYGLGTESMMNNGRMYYQSTGSFFSFNIIQILLTLLVILAIVFFKKQKAIVTSISLVIIQGLLLFII